jgi:hypothetical protein
LRDSPFIARMGAPVKPGRISFDFSEASAYCIPA